jgi:hypothetical protein
MRNQKAVSVRYRGLINEVLVDRPSRYACLHGLHVPQALGLGSGQKAGRPTGYCGDGNQVYAFDGSLRWFSPSMALLVHIQTQLVTMYHPASRS